MIHLHVFPIALSYVSALFLLQNDPQICIFSIFGLILMLASGFLNTFTSLYILFECASEWLSEEEKIQYEAKQQEVWKAVNVSI